MDSDPALADTGMDISSAVGLFQGQMEDIIALCAHRKFVESGYHFLPDNVITNVNSSR